MILPWDYALKNHHTSREAFKKAIEKISPPKESFSHRVREAEKTSDAIKKSGAKFSKELISTGSSMERSSFKRSSGNFQKAWKKLSLGYIHYVETNAEDFDSLKDINSQFFGKIKTDFKSIDEAMEPILGFLLEKSEVSWKKHFKEGKYSFLEHYEKSGRRGNSLTGLWDILSGYASWTYHSLISPSAKTVTSGAKKATYYTTDMVLKTFIAGHHVVYSVGSNVYYSTKLGFKVISPSIESGYLASLALLDAAHGTISGNALKTAGLINKVAVHSLGPAVGTSQLVVEETVTRAETAATFLIHGAEAASEVLIEKTESGVVLGYSALSQIPPQLLLTAANSSIFLIYDGPKLLLAKVTGKVGDKDIQDLPVGTVMDVKKMKEEGIKVDTLSEDPETIKKVLHHVE